MEMEQKDCSTKVEKLIEKHAWIASEKQLFGRSGTDYDFVSRDPRKAIEELEKLQAEQSGCVMESFKLSRCCCYYCNITAIIILFLVMSRILAPSLLFSHSYVQVIYCYYLLQS